MAERTTVTMGWDVGDRFTDVCVLAPDAAILEQQRVRTTTHSLEKQLSRYPGALVVLEIGVHSRWISDLVRAHGHQVIVANARQVQLIYRRKSKTDRSDALLLARLGRFDPTLLAPVQHRSKSAQLDLECLRARDMLVSARTDLINHVRGVLKPFGLRVPDCSSSAFVRFAEEAVPPELVPAFGPVLECLRVLQAELARYEKQIEHLATVLYPETARLSQVGGVGPITSLAYVLTIEEPSRFDASRTVGAFVGLTPAKDQSGESDPQKRISKAGAYGSTSNLPTGGYLQTNYWVDVLFSTSATPLPLPEPAEWYAGDMHVHRSCGGSPVAVATLRQMMDLQNLSTISLLTDMGNGEMQDPTTDLPLVNGQDDAISTPGRALHWDAEWHWDATYLQYPQQALGGAPRRAWGLGRSADLGRIHLSHFQLGPSERRHRRLRAHVVPGRHHSPDPELLRTHRVPRRGRAGGERLHLGGRRRREHLARRNGPRGCHEGLLPAAELWVPARVRGGDGLPMQQRSGSGLSADLRPGRERADDLWQLGRRHRQGPHGRVAEWAQRIPRARREWKRHTRRRGRHDGRRQRAGDRRVDGDPGPDGDDRAPLERGRRGVEAWVGRARFPGDAQRDGLVREERVAGGPQDGQQRTPCTLLRCS